MAVAAAALAALTPLGNAGPGDFSDGYLEIRIVNHPNNTPDLGELYLYVDSYNSNTKPTDIPLLSGSTTKFNGKGYYENGTGVTYKVKDLPQSGQLGKGIEWHGFQINQPAAAGMQFVLGFGCDERHTVGSNHYSHLYSAENGDPGGCISYDAPTGATGAQGINWGSTYEDQKGFGQRCAAFEVAYFCNLADCSGNGDLSDLTNINYYGFPMNVEGSYCSTEDGNWTQQEFGGGFGNPMSSHWSSKRYIRNDQWIRNQLKALMIAGSPGDNWYYQRHNEETSWFVRAVSPQEFPNLPNQGWHPKPSAFTFSPGYLAHLYSTYSCSTVDGFAIEAPNSAAMGHGWTSAAGAFKGEACFESADSLKIHTFTHLESDHSSHPLPLGQTTYEITCTIPSGSSGDGWTHMEHFVLSGDPGGSSATVTVTHNGQPYPSASPLTNYPMAGWDYLIDGHTYTDAIKGAFRQVSTAIQFGWLGNTTKVTDTHVGPIMAEYYIYLENNNGVPIKSLSTGKMQYVEPIYAWENGNEWFDRYGETMLLAQNKKQHGGVCLGLFRHIQLRASAVQDSLR